MALYDLEEQEQLSQIKAWWDQYGKYVTTLIVVAALGSVGWQGWNWYQNKQAGEASTLYFAVQQAAADGDATRAREAAGQIIERYSGTAYAEMGALLSAAVQVAEGEPRNARAQLEWVVANADNPAVRDLARLRIAVTLFDEGDHDGALARLADAPHASLAARYGDLRGDVLAAAGRPDEARRAYEAALAALAEAPGQSGAQLRGVVETKIEALES